MTAQTRRVPDGVVNLDPRLWSDECIPELVLELILRLARDDERPTSRAVS